jgi:hypothetical protein
LKSRLPQYILAGRDVFLIFEPDAKALRHAAIRGTPTGDGVYNPGLEIGMVSPDIRGPIEKDASNEKVEKGPFYLSLQEDK